MDETYIGPHKQYRIVLVTLRREIMGSYHKVSKKYLLLAESSFRHNYRKDDDMLGWLIAGC